MLLAFHLARLMGHHLDAPAMLSRLCQEARCLPLDEADTVLEVNYHMLYLDFGDGRRTSSRRWTDLSVTQTVIGSLMAAGAVQFGTGRVASGRTMRLRSSAAADITRGEQGL